MRGKIIITSIPAFYKINLFNELERHIPLHVIFLNNIEPDRKPDFVAGKMNFAHTILNGGFLRNVITLKRILKNHPTHEVVAGGWSSSYYLLTALLSPKRRNGAIIESGISESSQKGLKALVKKLFLKRMSTVYVPGEPHKHLISALGFKGEICTTGGVGLINYTAIPQFRPIRCVKHFLYVGRLVEQKNLVNLIRAFNSMPHLHLHIIGYGPLMPRLKSMAGSNIIFHGEVANRELPLYYKKYDALILPSESEPWGLVVEEALAWGMPVVASPAVGCKELLQKPEVGIVHRCSTPDEIIAAVGLMENVEKHNIMRHNTSLRDIGKLRANHIKSFLT